MNIPDNIINNIIMFNRPSYCYMKQLNYFLKLHGEALVKYQGRNTLNILTMSEDWTYEYIKV